MKDEPHPRRYGSSHTRPGTPYDPARCAAEVYKPGAWRADWWVGEPKTKQCCMPRGYGPGKAYCREHAARVLHMRCRAEIDDGSGYGGTVRCPRDADLSGLCWEHRDEQVGRDGRCETRWARRGRRVPQPAGSGEATG